MENKYYTPEISEFHAGFIYETNLKFIRNADEIDCMSGKHPYTHCADTTWEKKVADEYENVIEDWDHNFWRWDTISKYFRVKYLDERDIKSFGFKSHGVENYYILNKSIGGGNIILVKSELTATVTVIHNPYNRSPRHLFKGFIKNKCELKILLKQLGIYE